MYLFFSLMNSYLILIIRFYIIKLDIDFFTISGFILIIIYWSYQVTLILSYHHCVCYLLILKYLYFSYFSLYFMFIISFFEERLVFKQYTDEEEYYFGGKWVFLCLIAIGDVVLNLKDMYEKVSVIFPWIKIL